MKLTVTGRRITVTEPIRQQIDRKVRRLERLLNDRAVSAQIVLSEERQGTACEVTVHVAGGRPLHGLGRDSRITTAVGQAVEKVAPPYPTMPGRTLCVCQHADTSGQTYTGYLNSYSLFDGPSGRTTINVVCVYPFTNIVGAVDSSFCSIFQVIK